MAKTRKRTTKPAANPDNMEKELINKAMNLAAKQLEDGTASASVITHFLKLGASSNELELEMLRSQNELYKAKVGQIQSQASNEQLHKDAIEALKGYQGDK